MSEVGVVSPNSRCIWEEILKQVLAPLVNLHIVKVLFIEVIIVPILSSDLLPWDRVVHLDFLGVNFCLEFEIAFKVVIIKRLKNISLDQKVHIPVFLSDWEVNEGSLLEGGLDNLNWEGFPESGDIKQLNLLFVGELEKFKDGFVPGNILDCGELPLAILLVKTLNGP